MHKKLTLKEAIEQVRYYFYLAQRTCQACKENHHTFSVMREYDEDGNFCDRTNKQVASREKQWECPCGHRWTDNRKITEEEAEKRAREQFSIYA